MKIIFGVSLLVLVYCSSSQNLNDNKLATAIQTFQDAADMNGMSEAIRLFKKVSDENPNQWISNYWTAFAYSQIGRLSDNPSAYYDSAQFYMDRVMMIKDQSKAQQSDNQVLQSLVYSLYAGASWSKGDRENGMKYSSLDSEALKQALVLNRDNPRVYLISGTSLISDGLRNGDTGYLLAGSQMLEIARAKYEANKPSSELYPDWGKGWINFWKERARIGD
ncbi:MAG: hypothetical protein ABJP45_05015 [Cyclobacteriaceae bacterium]